MTVLIDPHGRVIATGCGSPFIPCRRCFFEHFPIGCAEFRERHHLGMEWK